MTLEYIQLLYNTSLHNNKIFIYNDTMYPNQKICIYSVQLDSYKMSPNTIPIHRKTDTNTFYSINALNKLIMEINNGLLDTSYPIDWDLYKDTMIITKNDELNIYAISFNNVITF